MEWKAIRNYEGYYEVSDTGLVRGVDRIIVDKNGKTFRHRGKEMKLSQTKGRAGSVGYLVVNLHKRGVSQVCLVHNLVASAFVKNPNNFPTVNHKDGDKTNNNVENLEWASYSENNIHALRNKLRQPRGNPILQKTIDGQVLNQYKSTCEAARIAGISIGTISHCLNHRTNSAGGFVWEKLSESVTTIPQGSTLGDELPVEVQERQTPKI